MARNYKPLALGLIDEGKFLKDVNDSISESVKKLLEYKKKYGKEAAIGSKAVINVKVTLQFDGIDEGDFSIKGQIGVALPSRPATVSKAIEEMNDAGEPTLFVRNTGSTEDSPRQGILTTKAGEVVDTNTGEVLAEAKK
jgi:hypothetical protein